MTDPNEALVEELARAICRSGGGNPVAGAVGEPTWVSWKNSARAILPIIACAAQRGAGTGGISGGQAW